MAGNPVTDIVLCSIVVYELRHGMQSGIDPAKAHAKLDLFLQQFASLTFDDSCAVRCAEFAASWSALERRSGHTTSRLPAIAQEHGLTVVTHNTREFMRQSPLKSCEDWEM